MNDQIMNLLAICLVLHPMRIDEGLQAALSEKYGEKIQRMEKGLVLKVKRKIHDLCNSVL